MFHKKAEAAYRARVFTRFDDNGFIKYFSAEDFPGLRVGKYQFRSSHGHILAGFFYNYSEFDPERLIVFDHGLGGGHGAYMKEIELLCRAGYRVFAYDHTGCMESGGASANGLSQSLCDLDDCLKALKADAEVNTSDISVMGHSWGGYAALNISALHPDIKRIVVISGFVSVERMIKQIFRGLLSFYRKGIMALEASANPEYIKYDGVRVLRNTNARVLLIYSDNDGMVNKKYHFDVLKDALQGKENIEFMLVSGRNHNPNYTAGAFKSLSEMTSALKKGIPQTAEEKESFKKRFDWDKMTAQDEAVWEHIKIVLK